MKEKLAINIAVGKLIILRATLDLDTMREMILYFKIYMALVMDFIKARLNRDNFWNLMFWFGMTAGWYIAIDFSEEYPIGAGIFSWLTIFGVPYIVTKASKVTFDKENGFFNCEGKSLKDSHPKELSIVIFLNCVLLALIGLIIDKSYLAISISPVIFTILMISFLFLVLTLYFIYKNCPIFILFNKNAFKPMSPEQLTAMTRSSSITEQSNNPYYSSASSYYWIHGRHYR